MIPVTRNTKGRRIVTTFFHVFMFQRKFVATLAALSSLALFGLYNSASGQMYVTPTQTVISGQATSTISTTQNSSTVTTTIITPATSSTTPTGTIPGTTTPGFPNTGAGGNTTRNDLVLGLSGIAMIAGISYLSRKMAR